MAGMAFFFFFFLDGGRQIALGDWRGYLFSYGVGGLRADLGIEQRKI